MEFHLSGRVRSAPNAEAKQTAPNALNRGAVAQQTATERGAGAPVQSKEQGDLSCGTGTEQGAPVKTGGEYEVKVLYGEGFARHTGLEPCTVD